MFGKHTYQHGSNPNRRVRLTKKQADAVLKFRFYPLNPDEPYVLDPITGTYQVVGYTNLTEEEAVHYDIAAQILNDEIDKNGPVDYEDDTKPVLTLIR